MTIKQFLIIVCTLLTFMSCNDRSIFNEDQQPVNATKLSIINKLGNKLPSKDDRVRIRADYEMGYKGTKCE